MTHDALVLSDEIQERTNPLILFEVQDEAGVPFQPYTLTLTLYDRDSGLLLGARPAQQDVLNANGVAVTDGAVSWQMAPEDNVIVNDTRPVEYHAAMFEWTWFAGSILRYAKQEIVILVRNLQLVQESPAL